MPDYKEKINRLLSNPEELLYKQPFFRGYDLNNRLLPRFMQKNVGINEKVTATLPRLKKRVISQEQYLMELEPTNHKVLYDQNIPSIHMKLDNGSFVEIEYKKMAVSYQKNILDKQVLHLCGFPMQFTLMNVNPSDFEKEDFSTFKQYWELRNQDGMREKMVETQKSVGDAGLLYYWDKDGKIKSRLLSYMDGFVLCPHNDDNGDRIIESVYYVDNDIEYIDSYDEKFQYRHVRSYGSNDETGWKLILQKEHGFSEIPLITKRGNVAWNDAQSIIESYEILYNIFNVIQKRHGWGILYIKGKFDDSGKKIAGSIILNSKNSGYGDQSSSDDAKFLTPPTPQGMLDTLNLLEETIQKNASTTFILPKDIKTSGDISGTAILLTQTMDIECALKAAIEWQNVADKMARLFKEGLAKELVREGIKPTAVTDFHNLRINAKFKIWRPQSETEIVNRITSAKGAGYLSVQSAAEANPDSKPDEYARIQKEKQVEQEQSLENQKKQLELTSQFSNDNQDKSTNNKGE